MKAKPKDQWIIRDENGKIIGPYTKDAIQNLIARGAIAGEEHIARHPGGEWVVLASIPEFYDLVLESLEGGAALIAPTTAEKMEANTVLVTRVQPNKKTIPRSETKTELTSDATKVADGSHFMEFTRTIKTGLSNLSKSLQGGASKTSVASPPPKKVFDRSNFVPIDNSIPTLTTNGSSSGSKVEMPSFDVRIFRFVMIAVLLIGVAFYLYEEEYGATGSVRQGKLHLIAPGENKGYLTPDEAKAIEMKVRLAFERDNTSDWMEAQDLLVKWAEADPSNTGVREYLCLAYKELWPYSYQDTEDMQVLSHVAQTTRALNPSVRHGKTCELIRSWATGKYQEAKGQLELLIQEFPNNSFYIWLKTDNLISEGDFINGQGFTSLLVATWPDFLRGHILAAQASIGMGRFQEARERLGKVLQMNPKHKVAKLLLGEIEYKNFQQEDRAFELLSTALSSDELVPRNLNVAAMTSMAYLCERKGDVSKARSFAEKAFQLNPTNEGLRALVKKFGGNDENYSKVSQSQVLIAEGDQFVRVGDCLAAQAKYQAAFDLNPKAPVAAVKGAKCLYKLNQVFQAFEILKLAIKENPDFFPAYTLLADYYSQKFDFGSAMGVLNQARAYSKEAYEIYKGYALVELRKNNHAGALGYAARALTIYSTDTEVYVIMSKAHLGLNQPKEAVGDAQKALEIDPISVEGRVAYGEALGVLQGENTGIEYLRKLANENKYVIEFKLALADALKDLDRFNESLPLYEEAVAMEPKNKHAQLGMGDSLSGIGKVEAALSSFLLAATFDPTDPEPVVKAGLLYLDTSRLDPAIKQFERALEINKNYPKAYYYIGKAAFMMGNLQKALDSALAERRANPNIVESYLLAAEVYMVTRKYTQCTTEYQQAIKIKPQGADNYVKLARCYRLSGSMDVAQSMLDIAAEKESGYAEIYKEQGFLYHAQGEKNAAFKAYDKYLALSPNATDKSEIEARMAELNVK